MSTLELECQLQLQAWEGLPPDQQGWLAAFSEAAQRAQHAHRLSDAEAERLTGQVDVLIDDFNGFPPDKRWAVAWHSLLPAEQRQLMQDSGVAAVDQLQAELAAQYRAFLEDVPPHAQAEAMQQLSVLVRV